VWFNGWNAPSAQGFRALIQFFKLFFFFFEGERGLAIPLMKNGPKFPKEMWAQNMAPQGKRV
jgi:hypothetical protein